ncbi:uncharacterized protein F4812DRAFT_185427 [Daldinia caldariorum]|uniref:uncharacterized protein n=1 Tax=Daldinia caldariorum TaxID=326644 RepID=UPI002007FE61|nr:uncharacterized protein F4812DRAFT_185427 [Daldinia caldariorum]KAI1471609.1 hypothetical protein F4812DRAFT_185427 [Daldinia caldariorum]
MAVVPSRVEIPSILSDTSSSESDHSSHDSFKSNGSALRDISISQLQNRSNVCSNLAIDSLTSCLKKLQIDTETCNTSLNWCDNPKNQGRRRLTRPAIAANTFDVLETVPEDESPLTCTSSSPNISNKTQYCFRLPASAIEKFSGHTLVEIARKGISSAKEQLAKHREGWFEGIISTRIPVEASITESGSTPSFKAIHLGFNLLPISDTTARGTPTETDALTSFIALVTPLAPGEEVLADDEQPTRENMALAEPSRNHLTPVKGQPVPSNNGTQQPTPTSSPARDKDRHIEVVIPRSPAQPIARIEDSVEALDELEEQLEAFDEAAHFKRIISPKSPDTENKPLVPLLSVTTAETTRSVTPQPRRSASLLSSSTSARAQSTSEPRRSVRKSASMIFLDPPKLKSEDKPVTQAPPKRSFLKGIASLLPPKQPPKSNKKPTIPAFELPGDEVARKLKEKREARMSIQAITEQATKPTLSSLRRSKSTKMPTRPNFELPGEAISRRKREEREAQLKAQEEEERKRREFKARPIRINTTPSTFPRDTVASRARQSKVHLVENSTHQVSNKTAPTTAKTTPRSPLSKTNNQCQPRGRGLQPHQPGAQPPRGSSSSTTDSTSAQHSSVSLEEIQQQRLRGQEIYKRDNSWTSQRERERREREALAKLAREEAAERSRQQSREWAAKQARKRMTVSSLCDVMP